MRYWLSNVGVEDGEAVLIDFENGELGQGADAFGKRLDEVLREVEIGERHQSADLFGKTLQVILRHVQTR